MENTINTQSSITQSEPSNEKDCSKRFSFKYKMLGVVTLYNPNVSEAAENIMRYAPWLDTLIVWDNSSLERNTKSQLLPLLSQVSEKIIWHGTGENTFIAAAIDYAWNFAKSNGIDFVLTMDQDSIWDDFATYRNIIEKDHDNGQLHIYVPYIKGCDKWTVLSTMQHRQLFINSGTVYPTTILTAIDGPDMRFPLDALDHDLSIRVQKAGYSIVCLTGCILHHTMGNPTKSRWLPLKANNYTAQRTYEITRSHVLNYRKHRRWLTFKDKWRIVKDFIIMRLVRIWLIEDDKANRTKMLFHGITDGIKCKL